MNIEYPKQTKVKKAPSKKNTVKTKSTELENIKLQIDELSTQNLRAEQNTNDILESTSQISRLSSQVATNTAGISTNADHIATNAQNISQLQANVQTNASYIQVLGATKQEVLTAGENITIQNNTISAHNTTYTAGANVQIVNDIISATDTTYTAGAGIDITNGVISATNGGGLSSVTAGDVDSESATQGQVLTADGQGGATWQTASGGGGLTQEQETKLNDAYNYYLTHVVEHDSNYSGETFIDYPEGTIFQISDSYDREYSYTSNSSLTFPSIYFSAEASSVGTISIIFDYKILNNPTNILVQIKLNNVNICNQIENVEQADTKYTFNKIVTADLSSTRENKLDITISLQGSSSLSRTLIVEKMTTSFSAPNVVVLNKLCPFDVINIDGTYYIADCTGETVKTAIISQNNMFNMNSLTWNYTNISANSFKFYPKLTLYDNIYQTSDIGYLYQNKLERFFSCIDSLNAGLASPTNFICCDFTTQKSENVSFVSCRTDSNYMVRYNHIVSNNSYTETTGSAGTGYCGKIIGARMFGNYYLNMSSIPNVVIRIDQGGEASILGSISGTFGRYSFGQAQDATMYLKNVTNNGKYDVECYVKKFDKIIKYDLSYSNRTFTLNSKTTMGYYDKFFKMNDSDYFVVKNNQLKFYRIEQE